MYVQLILACLRERYKRHVAESFVGCSKAFRDKTSKSRRSVLEISSKFLRARPCPPDLASLSLSLSLLHACIQRKTEGASEQKTEGASEPLLRLFGAVIAEHHACAYT